MNSSTASPVDVIYIMGSGRSGSTLMSSMLGTQSGVFSAGEVYNYKNFFETAVQQSRMCSCGAKLLDCEFWKNVRSRLYDTHAKELIDLKNTDPDEFSSNNYTLFNALKLESGCDIIVDSSKRHYRLKLLLDSRLFNVVVVHLVRDPRAYAYSSMLTEMKKGSNSLVYYRKLYAWQKKNLGIRYLYGGHPGYIMMRYEDLVHDSADQLSRLFSHLGRDYDAASINDTAAIISHEFSGNSRFREKGLSEVRLDTRYLKKISTRQWYAGSAMVSVASRIFGYPVISRRAPV